MDEKTIIGLLSGSLGTLIIKEIFDFFNKNLEFKRELKKITFTRKLEKAEKAISFFSTYLNTIIEIKKSLEVILTNIKDDSNIDISIITGFMNQQSLTLNELMKNNYESNAVHLYFELELTENENDIFKFIESLAETKYIDNSLQFWLKHYNSQLEKGDKVSSDFCWNKIQELMPEYAEKTQKVVDSLETNRQSIYNSIKEIKKQL